MVPLQIRKDNNAGTNYRSRNFNDHRQIIQKDTSCDHTKLDWVLSLKKDTRDRDPFLKKSKGGSQSVPSFHDVRQKPSHTNEHHDGPYQVQYTGGESADEVGRPKEEKGEQSVEKYYNFHETRNMVQGRKTMRVSGGGAQEINWQLQLRGGLQNKPDKQWKRYFSRSHQSFDMAKDTLKDPKYQEQNTSAWTYSNGNCPKYERNASALPIATIRDQKIVFHRWPGCEGTALNTWEELVADRKHGHKGRMQIKWETTLREKADRGTDDRRAGGNFSDDYLEGLGSKVCDNRSDGCIPEMLGKKKWHFAAARGGDPMAGPYAEGGDPKLAHIVEPLGEPNEEVLALRRHKEPRRNMAALDAAQAELEALGAA